MKCKFCHKDIGKDSKYCCFCEHKFYENDIKEMELESFTTQQKKKKTIIIIVSVIACLFFMFGLIKTINKIIFLSFPKIECNYIVANTCWTGLKPEVSFILKITNKNNYTIVIDDAKLSFNIEDKSYALTNSEITYLNYNESRVWRIDITYDMKNPYGFLYFTRVSANYNGYRVFFESDYEYSQGTYILTQSFEGVLITRLNCKKE